MRVSNSPDQYITQIGTPLTYDPRSKELDLPNLAVLRGGCSQPTGRVMGYALPGGISSLDDLDQYNACVDALSALFPTENVCVWHVTPATVWVFTWDLSRLAHLKGVKARGTWYRRFSLIDIANSETFRGWTWVRHVATEKHLWAVEMTPPRLSLIPSDK